MKNPPLTRDQQIHFMKTARERHAARLERMQKDPELSAFLRGEGGENVSVSDHAFEVSPEVKRVLDHVDRSREKFGDALNAQVDAYAAQSGNDPE